ncbi:hypothetical protein Lal_00032097 [Lupinus albus]|nr:hypothetical protein Lal_00032097 [Lupinus albus]
MTHRSSALAESLIIPSLITPVKSTHPNLSYFGAKIETCDEINDYVIPLIQGDEREHVNSNSIDRSYSNDNEHIPKFLNILGTSRLSNHKIKLKVRTPIMLLRNLDQSKGLCNGTRMIVNRLATHVIEAKVMTDKNVGKIFYIPRMSLSPSHSPCPFKLSRRQFSLIVSYAMTINKLQGQSLASVELRKNNQHYDKYCVQRGFPIPINRQHYNTYC